MAFTLTKAAKAAAEQTNKLVNIILEIDGIPTIYSAQDIDKLVRIGMEGLLINNFYIGGYFTPSNNKDLLSIKDGTTSNITQQVQEDKGAASSISTMRIALVDKDKFVSNELRSGKNVEDILSREANIYLGFKGTSHPEDSVRIFSGNITDFDTVAGLVLLTISHPDNLKRQSLLTKMQTELTASVDAITTTIPVISTSGFEKAGDNFLTSYIQVEEELMEVSASVPHADYFTITERGALGTIATAHDIESEVSSFYRLTGHPIELLLALYTSGEQLNEKQYQVTKIQDNWIFFKDFDIQENAGLVRGDKLIIESVPIDSEIVDFKKGNGESSILVKSTVTDEPVPLDMFAVFESKYDKLDFGAGLPTSQIDIEQHEKINTLFGSSFPELDLYIKETVNLRELIENDILYPVGAISVPRKGRISLTYTSPPLAVTGTKTLNSANIVNPEKISVRRNTNRKFYNTVEYKFDEFTITEKLQRNNILFNSDSFNRIRVGRKSLKITARGFRKTASNFIDVQSRRFIDRYKLGAETLKVQTTYGIGFNIEVGDIAIFDGSDLKMFDSKGSEGEDFKPRLMEVTNKSLMATTGRITLELTDTAFSLDGRYGVISPSSKIGSGTLSTLILKTSYASDDGLEFEKWIDYIGSPVRVYNSDFSFDEVVTLNGFDDSNLNKVLISPDFSQIPQEDWIMSTPDYDDCNDLQKLMHCSLDPSISVVSGLDNTHFDVAAGDVGRFFIGSIISLHNDDYSSISAEVEVIEIISNTITVSDSLGFTPDNTYKVSLTGFSIDSGLPYRLI